MAIPNLLPPVLHPAVVHLPIALLLVASLFYVMQPKWRWAPSAMPVLMTLATASALFATITGLIQRPNSLEEWEGTAKETWINIHLILGILVTLSSLTATIILWIRRHDWNAHVPAGMGATLIVTAILVAGTGWYGGAIVWDALPQEPIEGQLDSTDGGNPFDTGGSTTGQSQATSSSSPPPSTTDCTTYAPGSTTDHIGPYDGFNGEDMGVAGDNGLPIWELTVRSLSNSAYDLKSIQVPVCREIVIHHVNDADGRHDLDIGRASPAQPFVMDTPEIFSGQTATESFVVETTGSVDYYCSVGRHAQQGQKGIFTVAAP